MKSKYKKPLLKCNRCQGNKKSKELISYRGFFYCQKCINEKTKEILIKDQEYKDQLRKHMIKRRHE